MYRVIFFQTSFLLETKPPNEQNFFLLFPRGIIPWPIAQEHPVYLRKDTYTYVSSGDTSSEVEPTRP